MGHASGAPEEPPGEGAGAGPDDDSDSGRFLPEYETYRSWRAWSFEPFPLSERCTMGNPGVVSHDLTILDTGLPDSASMHLHRSAPSALPYLNFLRYSLRPFLNEPPPTYCSSMRSTHPPLSYEMGSNISRIWEGDATSTSIGWVDLMESRSIPVLMASVRNCPHMSHSGYIRSSSFVAMKVAKLSLSHRSFHHLMVTRLPNHWWASSCEITSATSCFVRVDDFFGSYSRRFSLNVTAPQFSMAPAAKSGTAIRSSLGSGYAMPKYDS